MSKRKNKKKSRSRKSRNVRPNSATVASTDAPTPETSAPVPEAVAIQVVAAVVEQIAAALSGDEQDASEEKRSSPRVALAVEINLASESHFYAGLSGDLSEGGVFVETYRTLPVGSEVALEFTLPNGTVSANGSVRWHRDASDSSPPGLGIAFEELREDERGVVHDFCKARAPLYYEVDQAS